MLAELPLKSMTVFVKHTIALVAAGRSPQSGICRWGRLTGARLPSSSSNLTLFDILLQGARCKVEHASGVGD